MFEKFERFIYETLGKKGRRLFFGLATVGLFIFSVWTIYAEIVLAKMLPGKNNNTFNVYVDLPNGSSIEETNLVSQCVVKHLQKEKEVLNIEVFLGMGSPLDFAGLIKGSQFKNGEHLSEIVVNLTNKHHRDEPSYLMVQRLRPEIVSDCEKIIPQTSIKFVEPPSGPPTLSAIVAEVYGENAQGIRALAERVKSVFQKTEGLVDIDIMQDEIYKKIEVSVDAIKVAKSGLNVKQVNDILYLAFEGMDVAVKNSAKYDDQIKIFLTLNLEDRKFNTHSKKAVEDKLASLKLMNSKGMMVPITEVIKINEVNSNPMIMTKDLHLMTNVMAETDMVSQVYPLLDARKMIMETFQDQFDIETIGLFDLELKDKTTGEVYKLKWDGEMKVTLDTFRDLGGAFIAALVLIFLLMVVYYKDFYLSFVVLLGSFLSIIGVILGHWFVDVFVFTNDTFFLTATSLIGFIALIGISSRNSLLLIDFSKALIADGMDKRRAIAKASATRAKPIFLTATAIMLASTLLASDAVFGGLGVSLIFGTIAAVIASLIIVPILMDNADLEKK